MSKTQSIADLQTLFPGRVIAPEDAAYDEARALFYPGYDHKPAAIIRAANDADVARAVSLARDLGVELAVRSGGHGFGGLGSSEGGLVIDLAEMRALEIDTEKRTAWAETGLTAGEYTAAVGEHGLVTGFGDTGSVGIGGITLGGGVGYLARKHGLTIDSLLAADVVTADGQTLRADAENRPDLFWALRGGGGNFGVATRFQFQLHPLESIYGGMLILPATPEVISGFVDAAEAAPEELSTIANIMAAPPMPFIPEELHGQLVVLGMMVFAGDEEAGQTALAPFRALAQPLADTLASMRYPDFFEEEGEFPAAGAASHTMFVDAIEAQHAEAIVEQLGASTAMMGVAQLRVLGGAVARVPNEATAYAHRGRKIMVNIAALYNDMAEAATHKNWVDRFAGVLSEGDGDAYVNFLGDEGGERVRQAYPGEHWERLRKIKAQYDPANFFHRNHNIPPAE